MGYGVRPEHLVLRHKASGKIASRKDQKAKALIMEAQRLIDDGLGGGITSLLVPKSAKDKAEIAKMGEIYAVSRVGARRGNKSGTSDRKLLKTAVKNDVLIAKLAVLFGAFVGKKPGPHAIAAKAFTRWLKVELTKKNSAAYQIALTDGHILFDVDRGDRWWADAFSQRRKTQS